MYIIQFIAMNIDRQISIEIIHVFIVEMQNRNTSNGNTTSSNQNNNAYEGAMQNYIYS